MRVLMRVALISLILAVAALGQEVFPKFSLSIATPRTVVKVGEPVEVDVTYRNVTTAPLPVRKTTPAAAAYEVEIHGRGGTAATETPYGLRVHGKDPDPMHTPTVSDQFITLNPQETMEQKFFANQIYDLSKPGVYVITVSTTVYRSADDWKAHKGVVVKSNTVQVTVTN